MTSPQRPATVRQGFGRHDLVSRVSWSCVHHWARQEDRYTWKRYFACSSPFDETIRCGIGVHFIQAIEGCVVRANADLWGLQRAGRLHWQGVPHCGLLSFTDRPTSFSPEDTPPLEERPTDLTVLTTETMGYRKKDGTKKEVTVTLFAPFQTESGEWKCGMTSDTLPPNTIRYGKGIDYLEALLDALVKMHATLETTTPKDRLPTEANFGWEGMPFKVGRAFWKQHIPFEMRDPAEDPEG